MDLNEVALSKSLRFHGSNLTQLISSTISKLKDEDLSTSFFRVRASLPLDRDQRKQRSFHERGFVADDLKKEDERKFQRKLHRFIGDKFFTLYGPDLTSSTKKDGDAVNLELAKISDNAAVYGACPAFETYLDISSRKLKDRFFQEIRPGDCVCGEIRSVEEDGITVRILCVDSERFQRDLEDTRLDVFIPRHDLVVQKSSDGPFSIYCKHKLLRAIVTGVNVEKANLTVSLKSTAEANDDAHRRLGIISESEMPAYFRICREESGRQKYDATLCSASGFYNPRNVETLCCHFGVPLRCLSTLSSTLTSRFNQCGESYQELRKMQSSRLAMKSVVKGIERLRNKQNTEAIQHFNKALEIDPDNVEGLVGRGALYANCESYEMAVKDFERALQIDSSHTNGRMYLVETLLAQGKLFEKRRRRQEAKECYERILEIYPNNDEVSRRLNKLNAEKRKLDSDSEEVVEVLSSYGEDGEDEISKSKRPKLAGGVALRGESDREHSSDDGSENSMSQKYRPSASADVGDPMLLDKLKRYYDYYNKAMDKEPDSENESDSSSTDGSSSSSSSDDAATDCSSSSSSKRSSGKSSARRSPKAESISEVAIITKASPRLKDHGELKEPGSSRRPEISRNGNKKEKPLESRDARRRRSPDLVVKTNSHQKGPTVIDISSPKPPSAKKVVENLDNRSSRRSESKSHHKSPLRHRHEMKRRISDRDRESRDHNRHWSRDRNRQLPTRTVDKRSPDRLSRNRRDAVAVKEEGKVSQRLNEDKTLNKQLTDMEKFISNLKSKQVVDKN